jgi:NADPH-dependent F420 reductase
MGMQIALLGGTGDIGEGLALRIASETDHTVTLGSRDAEKATAAADEYTETVTDHGGTAEIDGAANPDATAEADVVIAAVPAYHLTDTIESVAEQLGDAVLVSPAVGMKHDEDGFHYNRPGVGSVTELAAEAAPAETPVVGAFHNLAAGRLADLDASLGWDTIVVGDDTDAKATIIELADEIDGLRGLDGGPLANAAEVEGVTPLLINVARHNDGLHDLGVQFK